MFDGVPHHLELSPALAQGQALGDDVEGDQLGLQSPLAVLFSPLYNKIVIEFLGNVSRSSNVIGIMIRLPHSAVELLLGCKYSSLEGHNEGVDRPTNYLDWRHQSILREVQYFDAKVSLFPNLANLWLRSFLQRGGLCVDLPQRLLELPLPPLDVLRAVGQPHVVVKVVPLGPRLRLQLEVKKEIVALFDEMGRILS